MYQFRWRRWAVACTFISRSLFPLFASSSQGFCIEPRWMHRHPGAWAWAQKPKNKSLRYRCGRKNIKFRKYSNSPKPRDQSRILADEQQLQFFTFMLGDKGVRILSIEYWALRIVKEKGSYTLKPKPIITFKALGSRVLVKMSGRAGGGCSILNTQ